MYKSIAVLALAGSALARPALEARKLKTLVHTVVVTKTETVTYTGVPQSSSTSCSSSLPAYTPVPQPSEPAASSKVQEQGYVVITRTVTPTPTPQPPKAPGYGAAPKPSSAPAPPAPSAPAPAPSPSPAPAPPTNSGYMAIVEEYRQKLGLSDLTQDSKLESNALNTAQSGNGKMVHKLNPGTMAQVLAPGSMSDFQKVFVGGWLCERPNLAGISSECPAASQGWIHDSTGHADILISTSYTKIGCAAAGGILCCDLA